MATYNPANAASLVALITGGALLDGDIIELDDTSGTLDTKYNTTLSRNSMAPLYIRRAVTIRAKNGRGAEIADPIGDGQPSSPTSLPMFFTRRVTVQGFFGYDGADGEKQVTWENIEFHPGAWPNTSASERWDTIYGASGGNGRGIHRGINNPLCPNLRNCSFSVGEYLTAAPFDVTVRHPAANSPATWYFVGGSIAAGGGRITDVNPGGAQAYTGWGDATWQDYNWLAFMPTLWQSDGAGCHGNPDWSNLYLRDCLGLGYVTGPSSGTLIHEPRGIVAERTYADLLQYQQNSNAAGRISRAQPWAIAIINAYGNSKDSANPHVDNVQAANSNQNTNNVPNVRGGNFFFFKRPACRGDGGQGMFLQSSGTTALRSQHESPRLYNALMINNAKAADIASGANVAIDRLVALTTPSNPWNTSAVGSVAIEQTNRSSFKTADTLNFIDHATIELLSGDARRFADPATYQKLTKGAAGAAIVNSAINADTASLHAMFNAYQAVDASKNIATPTLRQMLDAPRSFSAMPKRLGIINLSNVAPATLITTDPLTPSGFNIGDSMTLHVSAGIEFKVLDLYTAATLRDWGTADFTYVDGSHLVQFRATSAALDGSFTGTISFGTTQFTWTIYTRSANQFPRAATPGATRVWKSSTGLTGLTGPTTINQYSGWIRFRPKSITGTQYLVAMATGGNVQGPIMSGSQISFLFRDAGSVTLLSYNRSSLFVVDQDIDIKWAFDPINAIYQLYINDTLVTPTSSTITGNPLYIGNQNWTMLANSSNGSPLAAATEFEIFYVEPLQFIDWSNDNRRLIAAQPNYLGPSGEGLTGTAPQIMMLGDAAAIEAGNGNRGAGGAFVRNGTAITAVNANGGIYTFPPNLKLAADPVSSVALTLGDSLLIDVYPLGFAKAGVGFTRAVTGVSGTFDAASYTLPTTLDANKGYGSAPRRVIFTPTTVGAGQISFTPDSGYAAPSPVNFAVAAAPVIAAALQNRLTFGLTLGVC